LLSPCVEPSATVEFLLLQLLVHFVEHPLDDLALVAPTPIVAWPLLGIARMWAAHALAPADAHRISPPCEKTTPAFSAYRRHTYMCKSHAPRSGDAVRLVQVAISDLGQHRHPRVKQLVLEIELRQLFEDQLLNFPSEGEAFPVPWLERREPRGSTGGPAAGRPVRK